MNDNLEIINPFEIEYIKPKKTSRFAKKLNEEYDERKLTRDIMNIIGLHLNDIGEVVDQDTGDLIVFESKPLIYNFDHPMPPREAVEIYFDIVNNLKLMQTIVSYYIDNKTDYDIINIAVLSNKLQGESVDDIVYGYDYIIYAIFRNGTKLYSDNYNVLSLAYADLVYRLSHAYPPQGLRDINDRVYKRMYNIPK